MLSFSCLRNNKKVLVAIFVASVVIIAPLLVKAYAYATFSRVEDRRQATILHVYQAIRGSEATIAQLIGARVGLRTLEAPARGVFGELEVINNKLDRLGRTCTGADSETSVNTEEVRQCVDACIRTGRDATSLRLVERPFVSCVSRCHSADGNGVSCARRYMDWLDGYTAESLDRDIALTTATDTFTRTLIAQARQLRRAIPQINSTLYACLSNANTNDCQSECESVSGLTEWRACMGRCSDITEAIPVPASAVLQIPAAPRAPAPFDEPPVTGIAPPRATAPVKETLADTATSCVTSCGTSRVACMVAAQSTKAMDNCVADATACLQACPVK